MKKKKQILLFLAFMTALGILPSGVIVHAAADATTSGHTSSVTGLTPTTKESTDSSTNMLFPDNSYQSTILGYNSYVTSETAGVFLLGNSSKVENHAYTTSGVSDFINTYNQIAIGNNVSVSLANKAENSRSSTSTIASTSGSIGIGAYTKVGEENVVSIGYYSSGTALNSAAFGSYSSASAENSIAAGYKASSSVKNSAAFGSNASASAEGAVSLGANASASGVYGLATGYGASSVGEGALSIGNSAKTGDKFAISLGTRANAEAEGSLALGNSAHTVSKYTIAIGASAFVNSGGNYNALALGKSATIGTTTKSYGDAIAIGASASVQNHYSIGLGDSSYVSGQNSVALGYQSMTSGAKEVSLGHASTDLNSSGTAYGSDLFRKITNMANGTNAHDGATVAQLISTGTYDATNKKITLSSSSGSTVDIDLSSLPTGGGASYTAGSHITITDDTIDTIGLIAYDSSDMSSAKLGGTNGTKLTNLKQATLSKVSTDAVTGSQLYATNLSIAGFAADIKKNASDITALTSSIADHEASTLSATSLVQTLSDCKVDLSLANINTSGENKIKDLAKSVLDNYFNSTDTSSLFSNYEAATMDLSPIVTNQIAVVDEQGTSATTDYVDQAVADKATKAELTEGLAKKADLSYVNEELAKKADLSYVNEALDKKADLSYVNERLDTKVDADASNIDVTKFTEKLGIGEIAKDNANLVTGGKVYEATQNILTESKSYTDSAIDTLSSQVDHALGQMHGSLTKDINRGVAKASALAALKPLDYDADDKFNFAVGYGHYKNGNSAALGAFYYANASTMFHVGATVGNGDTAFNAGISFKVGQGSKYSGISKAAMLSSISKQWEKIQDQEIEIRVQKDINSALQDKVNEQEERIRKLEALINKMG